MKKKITGTKRYIKLSKRCFNLHNIKPFPPLMINTEFLGHKKTSNDFEKKNHLRIGSRRLMCSILPFPCRIIRNDMKKVLNK